MYWLSEFTFANYYLIIFFERVIYEIDLKNIFPDDFSPPIVLYEPELSGSFYFTMLHHWNQSLTNLKNPITGDKGILVKSDSPLPNDYLLVYTIQSTDAIYSGGYVDINGVRVAQLTAQRANCALTIVGSVRGFKGDVVTFNNSNFGGSISVYAYK